MMNREKDLYELTAEITGIRMIVCGLSNQLDNKRSDTLTTESMKDALFGIAQYLDRIEQDLIAIDAKREQTT